MDNKKIFIDWINHKLRNDRPYINFDFEISEEYLKNNLIKMGEDKEENRKNVVNNIFYNIKRILDIIPKQDNENYNVFVKINDNYYENDNGEFLKEKLENVTRKGPNYFSGTCNFEILLEIIYLKIKGEYSNCYDEKNEFMDKITSSSMLIEIPSENLYFYVYDERGGIIVSGNNDKIKFKNIISKIDNNLLNKYWFIKYMNLFKI